MRIAMVLQQKTLIQRCFGITFHAFFMEGMSNHNQYHFGVQNLKKKKKYIYIYIYTYPKVKCTHINYILSKYL